MRLAATLIALLLLPAAARAASPGFQTPSGNIFCAYLSFDGGDRRLRCDMRSTTNTPPRQPSSCNFDWGRWFGLTPTGKGRRLCVSDAVADPSFKKLAYGSTWRRGPFTCRSRTANLRCTNTRGRGFQLSRSKQTLF